MNLLDNDFHGVSPLTIPTGIIFAMRSTDNEFRRYFAVMKLYQLYYDSVVYGGQDPYGCYGWL